MSGPASRRSFEQREAEAESWTRASRPLPEPSDWGGAIARTAVESLLGLRPTQQLIRWIEEPLYQALARRAGLAVRVLGPARMRRVNVRSSHAEWVDEHTAEVVSVIFDGERCRAAALRLERFHGRWLVTALEIG
ncbi:MAG: Rv3235 family protein [bacterium]|nr:Rv3235 family protein [bacterium]